MKYKTTSIKINKFFENYLASNTILWVLIAIVLWVSGNFISNFNFIFISTLILFFAIIIFCLVNLKERFALLFFMITFGIFMLGTSTVRFFSGDYWIGTNWLGRATNSPEDFIFVSNNIFLSLISILIGAKIKTKGDIRRKKNFLLIDSSNYPNILRICIIVLIITSIAEIYLIIDNAKYVIQYGYAESYISYKGINKGIAKIAEFYKPLLWICLSLFPSKKLTKTIISFSFIIALLTLGTGRRNLFIVHFILVIVYLIFRQIQNPRENWFTKKSALFVGVFGVGLMVFSQIFSYIRSGSVIGDRPVSDYLIEFFDKQGTGTLMLAYEKIFEDIFPLHKYSYFFGDLFDYLLGNFIVRPVASLFGYVKYPAHTIERALYGTDYAQTISYIVNPTNYLNGYALGSCYIAEIYHAFGFMGVIIFNIFLGWLLKDFFLKFHKNWWSLTIAFLAFGQLLLAPRGSATYWMFYPIQPLNILLFVFIPILAKSLKSSKNYNRTKL